MTQSPDRGKHPSGCNCPICIQVRLYDMARRTVVRAAHPAPTDYLVNLNGNQIAAVLRSIESRIKLLEREPAGASAAAEIVELEQLLSDLRRIQSEHS